uniref:SCAN box domain-containing protein n=2 Tax=Canis lupus familiaris TaxID=9615 RepID=A0A8C0M9F1_CANLF
ESGGEEPLPPQSPAPWSPSNQMIAEEPEVVLVLAPQVRAPPERFNADSVEDLETMPQRNPPKAAASRQRFRRFCSEDAAGPRDVLRHLQELAGQWLRPNIHTKEQIVEMLVQGQFQAVLPEELRARSGPEMSAWGQNHWLSPATGFLLSLGVRSNQMFSLLQDPRAVMGDM